MKVFVVFIEQRMDRIFLTKVAADLYIMSLHKRFNVYTESYKLKKIPKEHDKLHF